jgi:Tfp pilus assembly protein PilN
VPVEDARPRELVALGDIGFSEEELPRLDPYLPAAVGLALGGAGVGTVINLLPRTRRGATTGRKVQISPKVAAIGAAFVVGIGGLTFMTQQSLSSAKAKRDAAEEQIARASSELATLQPILDREQKIEELQASARQLLTTDVAWQQMVQRITANLPAGITLTSFGGQVTPPTPVAVAPRPTPDSSESSGSSSSEEAAATPAPAPLPVLAGTISFSGTAKDYPMVAAWLDDMAKVPQIANAYVTTVQQVAVEGGGNQGLTFSAVAEVAPGAQSDRLTDFTKAAS